MDINYSFLRNVGLLMLDLFHKDGVAISFARHTESCVSSERQFTALELYHLSMMS